ncbi:MAG TPA: ubiquitin-like small modifier protein 1 [Mycobacteriales bacterium]|nr:ubiquitin-like small modifier protein 1 [Mycobacteriales bacterium]
MTRVVIRLPAVLAEAAGLTGGQREVEVELAPGATVGQVLDAVADGRPRLAWRLRDETGTLRRYVNVFVGDDDVRSAGGLATPVADGDVVTVLPSVAGG